MIASSVVLEVRRLLAQENLSQRKIAALTGISRGSVGAIATGKRSDRTSLRRTVKDEFLSPTGPPRRCPGCGGMVYMPCRLCHVRAVKARSSRPPVAAWLRRLEEPLGLDLREEDRARYEQIRSQRADVCRREMGCEADLTGEGPPAEQDDLCGAFAVEDDAWYLDPADLRDAFDWEDFDWEDEEPLIDCAGLLAEGDPLTLDCV